MTTSDFAVKFFRLTSMTSTRCIPGPWGLMRNCGWFRNTVYLGDQVGKLGLRLRGVLEQNLGDFLKQAEVRILCESLLAQNAQEDLFRRNSCVFSEPVADLVQHLTHHRLGKPSTGEFQSFLRDQSWLIQLGFLEKTGFSVRATRPSSDPFEARINPG